MQTTNDIKYSGDIKVRLVVPLIRDLDISKIELPIEIGNNKRKTNLADSFLFILKIVVPNKVMPLLDIPGIIPII